MRFPKPIVYLGFFLILAAAGAGIYDSFFKSSTQSEDPETVKRRMVAGRIIDGLFDELKNTLGKDNHKIVQSDFEEFRKAHKATYISKYLILDQELATKKYTKEESLKKNEDFTVQSLNQLAKIYIRKFKLSVKESQP